MKGVQGLPFKFAKPGEGFSLAIVYLIWIAIVIAMYPLCKWYDRYKTNHKEKWWLSYL
jgi:amino acid permease